MLPLHFEVKEHNLTCDAVIKLIELFELAHVND